MVQIGTQTAPEFPVRPLSFYNLAGIVLVAMCAGLALAYVIEAFANRPASLPLSQYQAPFVQKNVAGTALTIPEDWFAGTAQLTGGFSDAVDLEVRADFGTGAPAAVGMLITPHSRAQSSAYLLDKVYLHQFTTEQKKGPPGLIGKPLLPENGYQNETVWYDPLSPMPFVAKCQAALAPGTPDQCLRTVRLTDTVSVTYSFSQDLLPLWPRFDQVMHPFIEKIGANAGQQG